MDHTYLDLFNYYMKQFLNHVNANFPGTKQSILVNYRPLLEGKDDKNDRYAKMFLSVANSHIDAIAVRDEDALFAAGDSGDYAFIQGVDLRQLWKSEYCTDEVRANTWRFLQLLLRLSRAFIPSRDEIRTLLQEVSDGQIAAPAKLDATLYSTANGSADDDDEEGTVGAPDIFGLGNLAGLAGLAGLGNGEAPDLSNLLKMGAEMLGKMGLSEEQVANAAASMDGDSTQEHEASPGGEDSAENVPSDNTATPESTASAPTTTPNPFEAMVNNPKVMGFVEKMKADMDAKGIDENNPAAVFQHLAQSGFSQESMPDLMEVSKELMGSLGGAGGLGGLLQGMMGGAGANGRGRSQQRDPERLAARRGGAATTRDRLRARLEAKRAAEAEAAAANTNNSKE